MKISVGFVSLEGDEFLDILRQREDRSKREKELRNEKIPPEDRLELLNSELKAVLDELAPLLAENSASKNINKIIIPENAGEVLEKLEYLLKNKDTECLGLLKEISALPEAEVLVNLIENFEYQKASEALSVLKEKLEIK